MIEVGKQKIECKDDNAGNLLERDLRNKVSAALLIKRVDNRNAKTVDSTKTQLSLTIQLYAQADSKQDFSCFF